MVSVAKSQFNEHPRAQTIQESSQRTLTNSDEREVEMVYTVIFSTFDTCSNMYETITRMCFFPPPPWY